MKSKLILKHNNFYNIPKIKSIVKLIYLKFICNVKIWWNDAQQICLRLMEITIYFIPCLCQ